MVYIYFNFFKIFALILIFHHLKMYDDKNLLKVNATDKYRYCLKLLDVLFTKDEIKVGSVEPTGAGSFPALNNEKILILKSKILFKNSAILSLHLILDAFQKKYKIKNNLLSDHWVIAKRHLDDKCKDTRRYLAKSKH